VAPAGLVFGVEIASGVEGTAVDEVGLVGGVDEGSVDEGSVDEGSVDEGSVDEGSVDEGSAEDVDKSLGSRTV